MLFLTDFRKLKGKRLQNVKERTNERRQEGTKGRKLGKEI
jgi:hypothetical protein